MHLNHYHYICTAQWPAFHHHHRPVVPPYAAPPFTALPITASSATRLRPARSVHLLQPTATAPPAAHDLGEESARGAQPFNGLGWLLWRSLAPHRRPPSKICSWKRETMVEKLRPRARQELLLYTPAPPIPIQPSDRLGRLPLLWGDQSQRVFIGHYGHVRHIRDMSVEVEVDVLCVITFSEL